MIFIDTSPIRDGELKNAYESLDTDTYYKEVGETTSVKIAQALRDLHPILAGSRGAAVLDFGCGHGHLLEALHNEYPSLRVAGTELPGPSADVCRAKGFQVFTRELHEMTEVFSTVVLLDVAEHLPDPTRTFEQCRSVLGPRGHLYIHTPRACVWDEVCLTLVRAPILGRLARLWLRTRLSIFHLQLWTDESLELALRRAGFKVVYLRKELGLSWPLRRYVEVYLGRRTRLPSPLAWFATTTAEIIFVRLRTLRNKAICLAEKRGDQLA